MKKLLLFAFAAILVAQTHAQASPGPGYLSQLNFPMKDVEIEGTPYYREAYRLGQVIFEGEKYNFFFRFNALKDRIELKDRTKQLYHLKKNEVIEPRFGGKIYQLKNYFEDDVLKLGYFIPLNRGETVLYFKPKKVFVQAKEPDNGYGKYTPPHYEDASEYYIQFGKSLPFPVELDRKSMIKALGTERVAIEKYSSRNQLNLRKERDAVKLVNYFNFISGNPAE